MSSVSSAAFLLWSILAVVVRENRSETLHQQLIRPLTLPAQFLGFLAQHLWNYDRFNCLRWNSGRQPGAFKRVMTVSSLSGVTLWRNSDGAKSPALQYSYLASVPLLVVFSTSMTAIKVREGVPQKPHAFPAHNAHMSFLPGSIVLPGGSGTRQRSIER